MSPASATTIFSIRSLRSFAGESELWLGEMHGISEVELMLEPALSEQLERAEWRGPCEKCRRTRDLVTVNTVAFDALTERAFADSMKRFAACGESHVVHFLAAHPTVVARQVPRYRALLNSGDLVVSDGTPIALVMRAKRRLGRRITATDGFLRVCSDGLGVGTKHYFVGGANAAVAEAFREALRSRFPGISIAGFEVPPFRPYDDEELARLATEIKSSGADIVWVGIGAPKQDVLAHRLRLLQPAPVIACIGVVFDFIAGTTPRAPGWMRAVGLEWLFRLLLEPRRLWRRYLIGNTQFVAGVLSDHLHRRI